MRLKIAVSLVRFQSRAPLTHSQTFVIFRKRLKYIIKSDSFIHLRPLAGVSVRLQSGILRVFRPYRTKAGRIQPDTLQADMRIFQMKRRLFTFNINYLDYVFGSLPGLARYDAQFPASKARVGRQLGANGLEAHHFGFEGCACLRFYC